MYNMYSLVLPYNKETFYPVTSGEEAYILMMTSFRNVGVIVRDITNVPF